MTRKLTTRQEKVLRRMVSCADHTAPMDRALGKQLVKRGLAMDTGHIYERVEWNRVQARLPLYFLTAKGFKIDSTLWEELGMPEKVRPQKD